MAQAIARDGSSSNSYRIVAKLATGGMAEIFLVCGSTVTGVERYCVLKRILPERAGDARFVQMFLDEARLATQLQHPNIASVYDIGMLDDSYFYTMEYVHGETVHSLLRRAQELSRPLPLACVLTIIAGAAAGLHHAHERTAPDGRMLGIVHRDVSPSNLIVSYEGNIKLVDFGVAMASDRSVKTRTGVVKGKIGYLSPEQCRSDRVDRRSDLFSLGIVAWEMLTGARLYRRASEFDAMLAIVEEVPPRPSSRRADIPPAVDDLVLRLLTKSLAGRFQTAAAVVEAVENASIQAGTTLSTAAVSRMMHDLFGHRAEPWLALEPIQDDAVTLVSRPLPEELVDGLVDDEGRAATASVEVSASEVRLPSAGAAAELAASPQSWESDEASTHVAGPLAPGEPMPAQLATDRPRRARRALGAMLAVAAAVAALALAAAPDAAPDREIAVGDRVPAPPGADALAEPAQTGASATVHVSSPVGATPPPARDQPGGLPDRGPERGIPADPAGSPAGGAPRSPDGIPADPPGSPAGGGPRPPDAPTPHPVAAAPQIARAQIAKRPAVADAASRSSGAPLATPARPRASPDSVNTAFAAGDYAGVVAACGSIAVTSESASVCTRAACRTHDTASARLWLRLNPAEQIAGLVHYCSKQGTRIAQTPALDCSKDPLDCR